METKITELKRKLAQNSLEFELINKSLRLGNLNEKTDIKNKILSELTILTNQTRRELMREARPSTETIFKHKKENIKV